MTRGMLYCMASQVLGGAAKATIASKDTTANRPANRNQSAVERGLLGRLAVLDSGELDAGERRRRLAANSANDHARIDATSQTPATPPRVSREPTLSSSVVAATQIPHKVAETRKLVRQSCPRRHRATQHPEKARKGRRTEVLLKGSTMDL